MNYQKFNSIINLIAYSEKSKKKKNATNFLEEVPSELINNLNNVLNLYENWETMYASNYAKKEMYNYTYQYYHKKSEKTKSLELTKINVVENIIDTELKLYDTENLDNIISNFLVSDYEKILNAKNIFLGELYQYKENEKNKIVYSIEKSNNRYVIVTKIYCNDKLLSRSIRPITLEKIFNQPKKENIHIKKYERSRK